MALKDIFTLYYWTDRILRRQPIPDYVRTQAFMNPIPQKAIDLILISEGIDQPWKWPGGGSGITLGYGCDIGADPDSLAFWKPYLTEAQMTLLAQAKGKTGRRAAEIQSRFKSITVTRKASLEVFKTRSLPREIERTVKAFRGIELMPPEVLGAMVSLVYNRGTDITDDPGSSRRREMRIIHEILSEFSSFNDDQRAKVRTEYIRKMALQVRSMKRLWVGQGLDGLLTRRDAEADLMLSSILI